ncbi:MAG: GWxTD domain-containing protein [Bacteroidota bacterium]
MKKILLGTMALVTLLSSTAWNQNTPESMNISADYARFRGNADSAYVEIYYSIPQRSLTYVAHETGLRSEADVTVRVTRGDSTVYADRWLVPSVTSDASPKSVSMNLVGLTALMLPEGEYTATMLARDRQDATRVDSVAFRIPIKKMESGQLAISDIELASVIRQGTAGSQFFKNTLEVIPNVDAIFAEDQPCYLYAEVYNITAGNPSGDYYVRTTVFDAINKAVISREKPRKRSNESSVIVDNILSKNLNTGTYTLVVSLLDSAKRVVNSSGRKFYVYNKTLGIDSNLITLDTRASMSEYSQMDEAELDQEYRWLKYKATDAEVSQFEGLQGPESKRTFLHEFWKRRPEGERKDYLARISYSNQNFKAMRREGYNTDRGRVHVVYGVPSDIGRHPSESDSHPYEIWTYNDIQGGVIFVFVQRQMGGEYELVHSTHRSEIQDPNWERLAMTR